MTGRPLRFLLAVIGGWTSIRVLALWPALPAGGVASAFLPRADAEVVSIPAAASIGAAVSQWLPPTVRRTVLASEAPGAGIGGGTQAPIGLADAAAGAVGLPLALTSPVALGAPGAQQLSIPAGVAPSRERSRWSGSAWLVARPGGVASVPFAGQLGGSQAGLRIAYALDDERRWAAVARVAAPLSSRGAEASVGVEWQPTHLPVRLVAEHRFGLDGVPGGPGVAVIGGLGPRPLGHGLTVEAYGQAGAIKRGRVDAYADGALRVARPVAQIGGLGLDLGAGLWGGAQRGASRLDVGPSAGLSVPVGGQRLRLAVDWRQRVAGRARPGSGPAVSLGTDF